MTLQNRLAWFGSALVTTVVTGGEYVLDLPMKRSWQLFFILVFLWVVLVQRHARRIAREDRRKLTKRR